MNTCVLMAEVIANPELRKTQDDRDVANMLVQFPGLRDEDPAGKMRIVGWGNIGLEMSQKYSVGDRIIVEGRLSMNLIEREGYKEKKAELIASRIYAMGESGSMGGAYAAPASTSTMSAPTPSKVVNLPTSNPEPVVSAVPQYTAPVTTAQPTEEYDEGSLDEIPF